MKKYLNQALIFAVVGLACGVYYRELTKFNDFTDRTMLSMAHPHVLMLGLGGFLAVALFVRVLDVQNTKGMKIATVLYDCGLTVATVTMLVRGTMEVMQIEITDSVSGMISGCAGLGHIAVAVGMLLFIIQFIKAEKSNSANK